MNRQRSLYQAGKLKKDRQTELEKLGLRWSVLSSTSWAAMFQSLCAYAEERRKETPQGWDGNVPANYKIGALSLGRWVNRQRSFYAKGQLKDEQVRKLEAIGLKWAMSIRQGPEFLNPSAPLSNGIVPIAPLSNGAAAPTNGGTTTTASSIQPPPRPDPAVSNTLVVKPAETPDIDPLSDASL